jgi:hypothetical protein
MPATGRNCVADLSINNETFLAIIELTHIVFIILFRIMIEIIRRVGIYFGRAQFFCCVLIFYEV